MDDNSIRGCELRNGIKKDTPVFKYIKLEYLTEILQTGKMKLFHTAKWEKDGDVYENFLLKHSYEDTFGGKSCMLSLKNWKKYFYGQSWTTKDVSDAMWRIYSGTSKSDVKNCCKLCDIAVKIRTTVAKLCGVINGSLELDPSVITSSEAYIGNVIYMSDRKINKWVKEHSNLNGESITDSFFIKRSPFRHENEVRIIVNNCDMVPVKKSIVLNVDECLFDEYVLDPRLNNCQSKAIKNQLVTIGVAENKIKKSILYTFEPKIIKVRY